MHHKGCLCGGGGRFWELLKKKVSCVIYHFRGFSTPIILEEKLINYFLSWIYRVGYRVEYMVRSFSRFKSNEMVIRQQILFLWSCGRNVGAQTSCRRNAYCGSSAHARAIQITSRYALKHHNAKNMLKG